MTLLLMAAIRRLAPAAVRGAAEAAATCRRSISAIVRSAMRSASALIAAGVRRCLRHGGVESNGVDADVRSCMKQQTLEFVDNLPCVWQRGLATAMTVDGGAAATAEKQAKKMSADEKEELKRRKQEKKQKQKEGGAMDVLALMIIEAEAPRPG